MNKTIKNITLGLSTFALFSLAFTLPALAGNTNQAGAQKVAWNLSGDVMPVPPYGSLDIAGSDTSSKLIVNQPGGKVIANVTGDMNGLTPNTTYTVYLSKTYTKYSVNLTGLGVLPFEYQGSTYTHGVNLVQNGTQLSGTGQYPATGTPLYTWEITSGSVVGGRFQFTAVYTSGNDALNPLTTMHVSGTVNPDGSITGMWDDNYQGVFRQGSITLPAGSVSQISGNTTWPGLLTNTVQPFTFTTDSTGSGSWHINLNSDDLGTTKAFSVWINSSVTVLISNPITLQ